MDCLYRTDFSVCMRAEVSWEGAEQQDNYFGVSVASVYSRCVTLRSPLNTMVDAVSEVFSDSLLYECPSSRFIHFKTLLRHRNFARYATSWFTSLVTYNLIFHQQHCAGKQTNTRTQLHDGSKACCSASNARRYRDSYAVCTAATLCACFRALS